MHRCITKPHGDANIHLENLLEVQNPWQPGESKNLPFHLWQCSSKIHHDSPNEHACSLELPSNKYLIVTSIRQWETLANTDLITLCKFSQAYQQTNGRLLLDFRREDTNLLRPHSQADVASMAAESCDLWQVCNQFQKRRYQSVVAMFPSWCGVHGYCVIWSLASMQPIRTECFRDGMN